MAGIFLEAAWLVTAALVVLLAGLVVRYAPDRDPVAEEADREA